MAPLPFLWRVAYAPNLPATQVLWEAGFQRRRPAHSEELFSTLLMSFEG